MLTGYWLLQDYHNDSLPMGYQLDMSTSQFLSPPLTKAVLGWDNRPDDTITDIGVLKAGGSTTPKDAPGRKGRLKSVTVEYKIVGDAPTAVLKI